LISLQEGSPDWALLDIEGVSDLPAIKWKLENIQKMNAEKRAQGVALLRKTYRKK
jgi:hypothetical protein